MNNKVKVRWFDGYYEEFDAVEVRNGAYMLWVRLFSGSERWIPLSQVRWFDLGSRKSVSTGEGTCQK